MFDEPKVVCHRCQRTYFMDQVASNGMRCLQCGGPTKILDSTTIVENMNDGNGPVNSVFGTPSKTPLPVLSNSYDPIRVAELWLPTSNEVDVQAVKHFMANLPLPVALEYYGNSDRRTMLVRGPLSNLRSMASLITSNWPKSQLKVLDEDPIIVDQGTRGGRDYSFSIKLEKDDYVPIEIWDTFLSGDPVTNILSTMSQLNDDERVWIQIKVNEPGIPEWLEKIQKRLKIESQRGFLLDNTASAMSNYDVVAQKPVVESTKIISGLALLLLFLGVGVLGILFALQKYLLFGIGAVGLILLLIVGAKLFSSKKDVWKEIDLQVVSKKVVTQNTFKKVTMRAGLWANNPQRTKQLAERLVATLGQYALSGGNRFIFYPEGEYLGNLWKPFETVNREDWIWLGGAELAGLWHPPVVKENQMSTSLISTSHFEVRSPDPRDVTGFFHVGNYFKPDGTEAPAFLPESTFASNIIVIGRPGAGKTNLLQLLGIGGITHPKKPFVVMMDPHQDMVRDILNSIPPEDADRVVYWNLDDPEYTISFNPLDPRALNLTPTKTAQNFVDIGKSLWGDYWGPRMQIPFTYALRAIALANTVRPPDDLLGLSIVNELLTITKDNPSNIVHFLNHELPEGAEKTEILSYFMDYFLNLQPHMRDEIVQPVLSKAFRFREDPMLQTFSCPKSTLNFQQLIQERKILLINTNIPNLGKEMSDFLGSLILNIISNMILAQGEIESRLDRVPISLIVDEFHKYSGVIWDEYLQQLRKFGGQIALGSQSLSTIRQDISKEMPGIIFAGAYTIFSFAVNADDAEEVARELGGKSGGPSPSSLVYLPKYHCYVRQVNENNIQTNTCYTLKVRPPYETNLETRTRIMRNRVLYSLPKKESIDLSIKKIGYLSSDRSIPASIGSDTPSTKISTATNEMLRTSYSKGGEKKESSDDMFGNDVFVMNPWQDKLMASPLSSLTNPESEPLNTNTVVEKPVKNKPVTKSKAESIFGGPGDDLNQAMMKLFSDHSQETTESDE